MKNLFGDNRQANILSVLRKNSALNIEMLAQRFGVSERTVRNDICLLYTSDAADEL